VRPAVTTQNAMASVDTSKAGKKARRGDSPLPKLPLNARTKLRDLLQQNLTTTGDFAGTLSLPTTTPLPVLTFHKNEQSHASTTLRFPVEKSTSQYDALVEVNGILPIAHRAAS